MMSPSRRPRPGWTSSARTRPTRRTRVVDETGTRCSVAVLAAAERLRPVPAAAFPLVVAVPRTVTAQALVSFRGNRYSVPPELARTVVTVQHRLGSPVLSIVTGSGVVVAVHHRVADGTGATMRTDSHVTALTTAVLAAFSTDRPHRRKQRIPPGPAALAAADQLRGTTSQADAAVVDLSVYAAAAARRSTLA